MTTRIKIENCGPELALVRYYNKERTFKEQISLLQIGEVVEIDVWDGHIPIVWSFKAKPLEYPARFHSVPPAHY